MTTLNRSTYRRLNNLNQIPSVWEGDRRHLSANVEPDYDGQKECIVWVDGSQGVVRAMDVVGSEVGPEAIVRTLLRAMEYPQGPVKPGKPQKIVVRDREIQFYLRGILQDLGIAIEYVPNLPLIDELFREFEEDQNSQPPNLPPQYAGHLMIVAEEIWQSAPWEVLEEHEIIAIEINKWDIQTLYVSILGMLGKEYGILLYRSLDSLKQFRASVLQQQESSIEQLEESFLKQDCLFITFERTEDLFEDYDEEDLDLADLSLSEVEPNFGNIHPLEGLRASLFEEEALTVFVALTALNRFLRQHRRRLSIDDIPKINSNYRITLPQESETNHLVSVKVATLPEVTEELWEMASSQSLDDLEDEDEDEDEDELSPALRDDLIPPDSFVSIGMIPWEMMDYLRSHLDSIQLAENVLKTGDGFPVILIQSSRPKAITLIEQIEAAGGLETIFFNPGEDPLENDVYDLGILQTKNGEMYLFGEFSQDDPTHKEARKKWDSRVKKTKGNCGLLVARGLKGASKGNPKLPDMMALFSAKFISHQEAGLGTLQRIIQLDWE
ncbi:hypothetical protein ACE1CI_18480 [Aerosakkonemataceae cyanobacterium BLCC-F50]|uniref:Uncharacterized protein n=1 Tax=Floridaenema flaviceps BLCC-F50 TaxID=3153642 RepID=A0ABV4XT70_9CYAN